MKKILKVKKNLSLEKSVARTLEIEAIRLDMNESDVVTDLIRKTYKVKK